MEDFINYPSFYFEKYIQLYNSLPPQMVECIFRYLPVEDYNLNLDLENPELSEILETEYDYIEEKYFPEYPGYPGYSSFDEEFTVYDGFSDNEIESDCEDEYSF